MCKCVLPLYYPVNSFTVLRLFSTDVDECLSDVCGANANCTDTDGSFECSCDSGYSGDGMSCSGMHDYKILLFLFMLFFYILYLQI